ncbi:hypothetical protein [Nannocystis pusilla]|uniref:hypothetical protein n=1 Tax=Nannocystis pusilla TaxID=889268 RepID=UPI003B7A14AB
MSPPSNHTATVTKIHSVTTSPRLTARTWPRRTTTRRPTNSAMTTRLMLISGSIAWLAA